MVNLEYVIKSDCKPTAISLFFKGQHSSIIPDPCPWAFSYNWHQILFWRRDLFSLAFSQQLASVCDLANEAHGSSSPNVSRGRSPDPFPSQPPALGVRRWLCCSFITQLSTGGWSWACPDLGGAKECFPGRSAHLRDMPSVLPQHALRHMLERLQVSLPVLCPQGAPWVEILKWWWELYLESNSTNPLPIAQFPPSSFTFSSLPDTPLSKTNVGLPCSPNSWEGNNLVCFSCLQTRTPAEMPEQVTHHGLSNAPSAFQHRSFANSALLLSPFLHQSFSFLTQLLGCGDQVCAADVQPPFCLLPLPSLQTWHFMKRVDVSFCSWHCGSTHSLMGFYQKIKDKTSALTRTKKSPEHCLQSAEIYYDRTIRAENEDAPGKNNAISYDGL